MLQHIIQLVHHLSTVAQTILTVAQTQGNIDNTQTLLPCVSPPPPIMPSGTAGSLNNKINKHKVLMCRVTLHKPAHYMAKVLAFYSTPLPPQAQMKASNVATDVITKREEKITKILKASVKCKRCVKQHIKHSKETYSL